MKWSRNTGQPYIRRANGRERAASLRDALRLAFFREAYGPRGFYVLMQRRCGPEMMAAGRTRADIVAGLTGARRRGFTSWARHVKRLSQGRSA